MRVRVVGRGGVEYMALYSTCEYIEMTFISHFVVIVAVSISFLQNKNHSKVPISINRIHDHFIHLLLQKRFVASFDLVFFRCVFCCCLGLLFYFINSFCFSIWYAFNIRPKEIQANINQLGLD